MKKQLLTVIICLGGLASCTAPAEKTAFPSVIEIIGDEVIPSEKLEPICLSQSVQITIYQWKNRTVLFGMFDNLPEIRKQIAEIYPEAEIKLYEKPFYVFDRSQCGETVQAGRWTHTLMTACLVADTVMQQEYMDYHARQTELFPEVAQGFCRADFRQLLVFRNGRQLMLVISIPEGENLDDLNPKTTENNPRVDEWNKIMANYQEGIEGTDPGEVWVSFK